jgi:hypothetical protein
MDQTVLSVLKSRYKLGHRRVLKLLNDLTEEQMRWHPTRNTHSIGWNAWHLGRWTDYLQARLTVMVPRLEELFGATRQIWQEENLSARWGLDPQSLGWEETGMGMEDAVAGALPLPGKDQVIGYMRRAFEAAERAVDSLREEELEISYRSPHDWEGERIVAMYIIGYHAHDERHLGQIAYLRREMGLPRLMA